MARAAHSFYLRNSYRENRLMKRGKLCVLGEPTDLRRIHQDIYAVGDEKDHIVPWRSAWRIAQLTRAQTRFVLAASGHIAGMINPPSRGKGGHWPNDTLPPPTTTEDWLARAEKQHGSWWSDWNNGLPEPAREREQEQDLGGAHSPP